MYLTKEQLQDAGVAPEKVQKFAALFPNGTEVTCEVCVKHPDVFSFGKQGGPLIRAINDIEAVHSRYDYEIMEAGHTCGAWGATCDCYYDI
jgi:hypothetical protein